MYRLYPFHFFNELDVEAIDTPQEGANGNSDYPFALTVQMRSGRTYTVNYGSETARNTEAEKLRQAVERAHRPPIETETIRYVVALETAKLRPYLNRIEKRLKDMEAKKDNEKPM